MTVTHIKYIFLVIWLILPGYVYADSADTIEFPDRTDITLENGLRIILIEHHEQPTISYRFLVKAGVINNPLGKGGLAEVTGREASGVSRVSFSRSSTGCPAIKSPGRSARKREGELSTFKPWMVRRNVCSK